MNKKIIIIGMILLAAGASYGAYAAGVFNGNNNGLVLDMDLAKDSYTAATKTFFDKSGAGNNGVSANAVNFSIDNNNKNNGAMVFSNGASDYVNVGNLGNVSNWTIGIWFYSGSVANYKNLFHTHFPVSGSSNQGVRVEQYTNGNLYLGVSVDNVWRSNTIMTGLAPNTWYYLVIVGDSSSNKLYAYVNGVKKLDVANVSWPTDFPRFNIGRGFSDLPSERYFNGSISNVKVYKRALSATEVQILFSSSKPKASVGSTQKGLVAYWPMDGESYNPSISRVGDKTPYENHGTNYGATLTTDRMGQSNGAMSFFTSASRIYISAPIPVISHNLSMSAWIYPTQYPSEMATIILGGGPSYYLSLNNNGSLQTYWYGRNPAGYHSSGAGTIPLNTWSYVAAVWSDSSVNLYVNGVLKNTVAVASAPGSLANIVYFGAESMARQFNGSISDIRIYNRTLSVDEINSLYGAYKPKVISGALQKGLVLDMPLTSSGTKSNTAGSEIMTDKTPYSNDGQNYGGIVASDSIGLSSGNYVGFSNTTSLNLNSFTISFWAYYHDYTYPKTFGAIKKSSPNCYAAGGIGWDFGHTYSASGVDVCLADGTHTIRRTLILNAGSRPPDLLNKWAHITYVVDRSLNKITAYVNGVKQTDEVDVSSVTGSISNPIGMTLGGLYGWTTDGSLSGLKVYNRPLSATEIKSLYERGR